MKRWAMGLIFVLSLAFLSGCGGTGETAAVAIDNEAGQAGGGQGRGNGFESAYLSQAHDGALPVTMQLTLGTLQLEGTENAVTPEQAGKLVTFWQALQSDSVQNAAERNAILKQIEATMTAEQMEAIEAMQLAFEDMTAWAESSGIELPQGGRFAQGDRPGQGQGGGGAFANLTEEQRAELRELSPEERVARLRELGVEIPEGFGQGGDGGQGGGGQRFGQEGGQGQRRGGFNALTMTPLVELLTARAAE